MASNIRNCPIIPPILSEELVLLQIEDLRLEISRREQEILQMSTKMKTLEEQHQDYQKHIAVLKESLCAKEEHYTMLQTDVSSVHSQANRKVQHTAVVSPCCPCLLRYTRYTHRTTVYSADSPGLAR